MKKLLLLASGLLLLTGCGESSEKEKDAYSEAVENNEKAVRNVILNDELPKIERSLERENIKRRIEFINQADRVGYLYLLSETGQLVKEVQVKGKVSSLNSYLTPMEEIRVIRHRGGDISSVETPVSVQSSDIDGTWGENDNGIFWFTPDGVYQEWTGLYLYSSERMSFEIKPILMEAVNE